jgi:hypothetical protein
VAWTLKARGKLFLFYRRGHDQTNSLSGQLLHFFENWQIMAKQSSPLSTNLVQSSSRNSTVFYSSLKAGELSTSGRLGRTPERCLITLSEMEAVIAEMKRTQQNSCSRSLVPVHLARPLRIGLRSGRTAKNMDTFSKKSINFTTYTSKDPRKSQRTMPVNSRCPSHLSSDASPSESSSNTGEPQVTSQAN